MKKNNHTVYYIIIVGLFLLLTFSHCGNQRSRERIKELDRQNEAIDDSLDILLAENRVLKQNANNNLAAVEQLYSEIFELDKKMKDEIDKINRVDIRFRELPKTSRDSIIRAYIRDNQ